MGKSHAVNSTLWSWDNNIKFNLIPIISEKYADFHIWDYIIPLSFTLYRIN